jgi:hypothetical protein
MTESAHSGSGRRRCRTVLFQMSSEKFSCTIVRPCMLIWGISNWLRCANVLSRHHQSEVVRCMIEKTMFLIGCRRLPCACFMYFRHSSVLYLVGCFVDWLRMQSPIDDASLFRRVDSLKDCYALSISCLIIEPPESTDFIFLWRSC